MGRKWTAAAALAFFVFGLPLTIARSSGADRTQQAAQPAAGQAPSSSSSAGQTPAQTPPTQSPATQAGATPAAPPTSGHKIICPITAETAPPLSAPMASALKLYRTGKFDEAIAAYNAIIPAGGSEAAAAYPGLARAYLQRKDPTDAYAAAVRAVELTPGRAPAVVAMGEVHYRQGKIIEAEAEFLKPLQACNLDARAHLGLNRIYRATLNWKRAKTNIDQAYKLDPGDPDIRRAYLATLGGAERIKALPEYLAGDTDDDAEARDRLKNELTVLQGESDHPQSVCRLVTKVTTTETRLE